MNYIQACRCQAWQLEIWPKNGSSGEITVPFVCHSWRHEGECRLWKGAQDFCRVSEGMAKYDNWCHVTLTFAQAGRTLDSQVFKNTYHQWSNLRKRIIRRHGKFVYVQTWEVTRKKWPHCHVALHNPNLFAMSGADPINNFHRLLRDDAVECGFGKNGWCEALADHRAMSGYMAQLANELTGQANKAYQVPINAPPRFRRLRATQGLLPPVRENEDYTGRMVQILDDGEIVPLKRNIVSNNPITKAAKDGGPCDGPSVDIQPPTKALY